MICAGIDVGSRTVKAVIFDTAAGRLLGYHVEDQGPGQGRRAARALAAAARDAGVRLRDVAAVAATGYGRDAVACADVTATEITCQARGARLSVPGARTVIDIGGQDSKVIMLDGHGRVRDFVMNDRCAAGTGRFLEVAAARLRLGMGEFDKTAARAMRSAFLNSACALFAESEITGLLAAGEKPAAIAAGVEASIARRIASMASGRISRGPVVFTGGAAALRSMKATLAKTLGCGLVTPRLPVITCALGAAMTAESGTTGGMAGVSGNRTQPRPVKAAHRI